MDYRKGSIGRVFIVRVDHGEDLLDELTGLALKEDIKSAFFMVLGAMGEAKLVTGPREKSVPPDIVWSEFNDVREVIGAGNIFMENGSPKIHLHAAAGSKEGLTMGCIRKMAEAFMVLEIFIMEVDIKAERLFNEKIGASQITFKKQ
jgi:predicted DNA-binding protein with PD1-like motif